MKLTAFLLRRSRLSLFVLFFTLASLAASAQTTYYVDSTRADDNGAGTSWATARKYVQSGIDMAASGDAVWVAKGTYKPTTGSDQNAVITLKDGVLLYGGFNGTETALSQRNTVYNLTILSGDLNGDDLGDAAFTNTGDNSKQVLYYNTTGSNHVGAGSVYIDGFTVKGGSLSNQGGGLYFKGATLTANNMVFLNNRSGIGGAVCVDGRNALSTFTNCVFYNNYGFGPGSVLAVVQDEEMVTFTNCVVAGNLESPFLVGGSRLTLANTTVYGNTNTTIPVDYGMFYAALSDIVVKNTILNAALINGYQDFTAQSNGSNFSCTYSCPGSNQYWGSKFSKNIYEPSYQNAADPIGPDGIWRTADDGLRTTCASLSIDAGDPATVLSTDITGNPRIGTVDIGAYEAANGIAALDAIPAANTASYATQSGTIHYSNCVSEVLALTSAGASPVSGGVTAKVWIEATQPAQYVKRHYEIAPASNFATTTGTVTLYFTQSDFDDFNAVNGTKLPTGSGDATGISNLRIEQRTGTSSNGNGLPGSYPITTYPAVTFAPLAVTWSTTASRWEVSFDGAGFGGYFVKTVQTALPLQWMNVGGSLNAYQKADLTWKVAEVNVANYTVEKSMDAARFTAIGRVPSKGDGTNTYTFGEGTKLSSKAWYRILQTDNDGRAGYSKIVTLSVNGLLVETTLIPNPAKDVVTLTVSSHLLNTEALLFDAAGKSLQSLMLSSLSIPISLKGYAPGIYLLKLADGTTKKIVKQ